MIIPESLCRQAPGLLGRLVAFIEEAAVHKQPALSLCAALSFLSVIKAHRVRSITNLRTNILCVSLAPSGDGKGHGLKAVSKLFHTLERGYLLSGVPASDVGMVHALSETGKKLILWDEFGLALKDMTSLRAPSYKANIVRSLMETFSASDQRSLGLQYKNSDGKSARIDIHEPCLSLYAASTPLRFFEALNSSYVMDGFLPRLFIFEGNPGTKVGLSDFSRNGFHVPIEIVQEIDEKFPVGNLDSTASPKKPKVIEFDKSLASMRLNTIINEFEHKRSSAIIETQRAIYARAIEHFVKLCLIAEDTQLIRAETACWCSDLLDYLIGTSIEISEKKVFDNYEEKRKRELTEIIAKEKIISRRDLARKTRSIKNYEREQIIKDLLEAEFIECFSEIAGDGNRRKKTFYYRILE